MKRLETPTVMKNQFLRGVKASLTVRNNINSIFESNVTMQQTVSNWFAKLHTGNFNLTNKPCGGPETRINNDEQKVPVGSDPSQSVYDLALKFG